MKLLSYRIISTSCFIFLAFVLHAQIQLLNDEFNVQASLNSNWLNINDVEQWNAEHLEAIDINATKPGKLYMLPWTTSWYQDYRGTLIFKNVDQNFVFTTRVSATNRAENGIPSSDFSLAGLMIRSAQDYPNGALGASGWAPNLENYIFLSAGRASGSGPQFEVKNTVNGNSNLQISNLFSTIDVEIRVARIDDVVIVLNREAGGNWEVHARYLRADFPSSVQIGFVSYTDYYKVATYSPIFQNSNVINSSLNPDPSSNPGMAFNPDLVASFDFGRFDNVAVPAGLVGINLFNQATDVQLLNFLGYASSNFCPNHIDVVSQIASGQIAEMHSAQSMLANHLVLANAQMNYTAATYIEFANGYEVEASAEMNASIEACPIE